MMFTGTLNFLDPQSSFDTLFDVNPIMIRLILGIRDSQLLKTLHILHLKSSIL